MAEHFIHGFNVWDGGKGSVGKLARHFPDPVVHDYGWTFLLRLRFVNDRTVEKILPCIKPGDTLVAHSNGCLIAWQLVMAGAPVAAVICIQPALRRDTRWPEDLPVLCCYNPSDYVVELGRMWSRFVSVANPLRDRHGWGAAGRSGFTRGQPCVVNWNTETPPCPATDHSGMFESPARQYWAPKLNDWRRKAEQRVDVCLTAT